MSRVGIDFREIELVRAGGWPPIPCRPAQEFVVLPGGTVTFQTKGLMTPDGVIWYMVTIVDRTRTNLRSNHKVVQGNLAVLNEGFWAPMYITDNNSRVTVTNPDSQPASLIIMKYDPTFPNANITPPQGLGGRNI